MKIRPTSLFIFGGLVIFYIGLTVGVIFKSLLIGISLGIGGVLLFTILDLINIWVKNKCSQKNGVTK